MNEPIPPSGGEMIAVWTRQYVRRSDIGSRIHMTDERMTSLVNEARRVGFREGVQAGRYDLRQRLNAAGCRCSPEAGSALQQEPGS